MTQAEKQLLLQDLCARLPYGVKVHLVYDEDTEDIKEMGLGSLHDIMFDNAEGKPYLRPMSSMTEEEKEEYCNLQTKFLCSSQYPVTDAYELFDWLNAHHFDYRNLIERGLAIEVTEENNPYKE